jgi:hypothetical protein
MNRRHLFGRLLGFVTGAQAGGISSDLTAIPSAHPPFTSVAEWPDWLREWQSLTRRPVWEAFDRKVSRMLWCARTGESLPLIYHGGSSPGDTRWFSPSLVFQVEHPESGPLPNLYVTGWCYTRKAHRTLRMDRLDLAAMPFG